MNLGRRLYQQCPNQWALGILFLGGLLLDGFVIYQLPAMDWETLNLGYPLLFLLLNFCFIYAPIWSWIKRKNQPVFHEQGVGYYHRKQLTSWESYQQFESVRCFIKRGGYARSDIQYVLAFYRTDASMIEINQTSVDALKEIWRSIVAQHPELKNRLTVGTELGFCYEIEQDENGQWSVTDQSHQIKPDEPSCVLLAVLKQL